MEGFPSRFPPCSVYANPLCGAPLQGGGWGKREGRFLNPQGLNYLELCKAILYQVNPGFSAAVKKANTKECGVQVNAKVDKVVQCSLGPKTLFGPENEPFDSTKFPESPQQKTPPTHVSHLRYLRPVSIYSPVFDRRLFLKRPEDDGGSEEDEAEAAEGADSDPDAEVEENSDDMKTTFRQSPKGSNFQVGSIPVLVS